MSWDLLICCPWYISSVVNSGLALKPHCCNHLYRLACLFLPEPGAGTAAGMWWEALARGQSRGQLAGAWKASAADLPPKCAQLQPPLKILSEWWDRPGTCQGYHFVWGVPVLLLHKYPRSSWKEAGSAPTLRFMQWLPLELHPLTQGLDLAHH